MNADPAADPAGETDASEAPQALPAFSAYGIEIEYMLVERRHLDVRPIANELLCSAAGHPTGDVVRGDMGWSNELALHVIEIKNLAPTPALEGLVDAFHGEVLAIEDLLASFGARLMPGGMHPWMDPATETRLWTQDRAALYSCYDRIFDCRRHGWGNLQSMHLNLPFAGDEEFARLHAAVRLALPILPALAASSPWADKRPTGCMDYRLAMYRDHQRQVPSSMGRCIPEAIASPAEYRSLVLAPMFREIAEYDDRCLTGDTRVLQHEWLNVRGAVPRFERSAIEVRVLDSQECPLADLAVAAAAVALIRQLYDGPCANGEPAEVPDLAALAAIFDACIHDAERATISDRSYLALLGHEGGPVGAGALWADLVDRLAHRGLLGPRWLPALGVILEQGPLARRLAVALDDDAGRLHSVYGELCECLHDNRQFLKGS